MFRRVAAIGFFILLLETNHRNIQMVWETLYRRRLPCTERATTVSLQHGQTDGRRVGQAGNELVFAWQEQPRRGGFSADAPERVRRGGRGL